MPYMNNQQLAQMAQGSGRTLDQVLAHFGLGSGNQTVQPAGPPGQTGGRPTVKPQPAPSPPFNPNPPPAPSPPFNPPPPGKQPTVPGAGPLSPTAPGSSSGGAPTKPAQPSPAQPAAPPSDPMLVTRGGKTYQRGVSGKGNPILTAHGPNYRPPAAAPAAPGPSAEALALQQARGGMTATPAAPGPSAVALALQQARGGMTAAPGPSAEALALQQARGGMTATPAAPGVPYPLPGMSSPGTLSPPTMPVQPLGVAGQTSGPVTAPGGLAAPRPAKPATPVIADPRLSVPFPMPSPAQNAPPPISDPYFRPQVR
jgi:hypothetical protein